MSFPTEAIRDETGGVHALHVLQFEGVGSDRLGILSRLRVLRLADDVGDGDPGGRVEGFHADDEGVGGGHAGEDRAVLTVLRGIPRPIRPELDLQRVLVSVSRKRENRDRGIGEAVTRSRSRLTGTIPKHHFKL